MSLRSSAKHKDVASRTMSFWEEITADSNELEFGPRTISAGFPSSPGVWVRTVMFQLSGFYCKAPSKKSVAFVRSLLAVLVHYVQSKAKRGQANTWRSC